MTASERRADPAKGVFETLLVLDGEPVELEAHLGRLALSVEAIYAQALPAQAEEKLRSRARGIALGRLRLTCAPGEDGLRLDLLACGVESEAVFPVQGSNLRSQPMVGGLGQYKWVDRRGIERPSPDETGALISDAGELLEAGWANLFAVREETLWTPPLDGRILPGTTRAAILALAAEEGIAEREAPLSREDVFAAEEVFLSGSIRGIEPALELDGQPLAGCGPVSRRLAAALRRRWGLPADAAAPPALATAQSPGPPAH